MREDWLLCLCLLEAIRIHLELLRTLETTITVDLRLEYAKAMIMHPDGGC